MSEKYKPLEVFLGHSPAKIVEITLSFTQIEQILGSSLPPSAHNHRPWWANQSDTSNRPQAAAWLSAGWKVDSVNLEDEWVRFHLG